MYSSQSVYCSAFRIFVPSVGALLFKQSPSIVMTCCLVFLEKICELDKLLSATVGCELNVNESIIHIRYL